MQFRDLKRQYEALKEEIDAGIMEVLDTAAFIGGAKVGELEERLAEYVGVKHCVTCANGTDALTLALTAWGIGEGDCAFVPDFTFFASAEAIAARGAVPVFVDVDKATFNVDPVKLERAIRTVLKEGRFTPRVIVAVDLFGLPADHAEIRRIAGKYGLLVLEDGAQGFGGELAGRKACSFGDISTTSFFPAKPLGCYGDGGATFTNDDGWAELLRSLRVHGKGRDKYDNVRIGFNSRLDTIQAAVLLAKFKAFTERELDAVNRVAERYTERLKDIVTTPAVPQGYRSSWAQYCILLETEQQRDDLALHLKQKGIPTMVYYPKTMSEQRAFAGSAGFSRELEVSAGLCKTILALPMHPYLSEQEISYIVTQIENWRDGLR